MCVWGGGGGGNAKFTPTLNSLLHYRRKRYDWCVCVCEGGRGGKSADKN